MEIPKKVSGWVGIGALERTATKLIIQLYHEYTQKLRIISCFPELIYILEYLVL